MTRKLEELNIDELRAVVVEQSQDLSMLAEEYNKLRVRYAELRNDNQKIANKLQHLAKDNGNPALKTMAMNLTATPKADVLKSIPSAHALLQQE